MLDFWIAQLLNFESTNFIDVLGLPPLEFRIWNPFWNSVIARERSDRGNLIR